MGDLGKMTFTDAYQKLVQAVETFRRAKVNHHNNGAFQDADYFPCWYCSMSYNKVGWLKNIADHPWSNLIWEEDVLVA